MYEITYAFQHLLGWAPTFLLWGRLTYIADLVTTSAIGRDGNDDIFLIAWAVVKAENKESWILFLTNLLVHIGTEKEEGWTFILDR